MVKPVFIKNFTKDKICHKSKNFSDLTTAECASQVGRFFNIRKIAFTLAEVLIVLGILGIVAALTLPTLIENVQKQQYVAQLKKFYTTMDNGFGQMLAADGVEQLQDTSVFAQNPDSCADPTNSDCQAFYNELHKYFKFTVANAPSGYYIKGFNNIVSGNLSGHSLITFSDGAVILDNGSIFYKNAQYSNVDASTIKSAGGHMFSYQAFIIVDVNGFKKPNQYGRDIFYLTLSGDGKIYPWQSRDFSIWTVANLSSNWQNMNGCGINTSNDDSISLLSNSDGRGCAARIMEAGWQMNY